MTECSRKQTEASRNLLDYPALVQSLDNQERLVVAVSGGADSIALLVALHELAADFGIKLCAVHANHATRPEADDDQAFVAAFCSSIHVELFAEKRAPAREELHVSEAQLRDFRYGVYRKAATHFGTRLLALGHTADDMGESLLMNLIRGTGLGGYAFRYQSFVRKLTLVRPMWKTSRSAVLAFLGARRVDYRHDSSNDSLDYTRNRVRHVLVPLLETQFNPRVREALVRNAELLGAAHDVVDDWARSALLRCEGRLQTAAILPRNWLLRRPEAVQGQILFRWLTQWLPPQAFVSRDKVHECWDALRNGEVRVVQLPLGYWVVVGRAVWFGGTGVNISDAPQQEQVARGYARCFSLPLGKLEEAVALEGGETEVPTFSGGAQVSVSRSGLVLRNRRPGDRLVSGPSLKDVLINDKVPFYLRDNLLILVEGTDTVVHVVGLPRVNGRIGAAAPTAAVEVKFVRPRHDDNALHKGT